MAPATRVPAFGSRVPEVLRAELSLDLARSEAIRGGDSKNDAAGRKRRIRTSGSLCFFADIRGDWSSYCEVLRPIVLKIC